MLPSLLQMVSLFMAYFGDFTEAAIKNNFVLIYELLDEVKHCLYEQQLGRKHARLTIVTPWACPTTSCVPTALQTLDYGWPQMADPAVLKQYIFQKGLMTQSARQRREDKAAQSTLQVASNSIHDDKQLSACCSR
jgi:hypothetical protein